MQIPNARVRKMIIDLREIADVIKYVDYPSATKLEGMAAFFEGEFKANPTKGKRSKRVRTERSA